MSPEELAAQDGHQLANLRAAWAVLCADVVPFNVPEDAFDAKVLPPLLALVTQEQLVEADASLGTIRRAGDVEDIDSPLWEACAGEADEMAALLASMPHTDLVNLVLEEMFATTGNL